MVMKIENYEGTADTFTWPYNPQSFDDPTGSNYQITQIGFQRHHILVSGGGMPTKSLILTGHFSGPDKTDDWRDCSSHFMENIRLKKLYYEDDKFHLGIGKQIKRTHAGGRTNFIDYVGTFETIVGILFGDTEKTSGTNDGNTKTFVTKISGTITDGSQNVIITDGTGNQITINKSQFSTGDTFLYKFVEMVDSGSGIYVSEYSYVEINGTQTKSVLATDGFGVLQINPGDGVSSIVINNLSGEVVTFRDGWVD